MPAGDIGYSDTWIHSPGPHQVEVENERRVAAHVQFTQERELMMKEKEMAALNTILTQERRLLLDKEEEVKTLRAAVEVDNKVMLTCKYFTKC